MSSHLNYGILDSSKKIYSTSTKGVIDAPIQEVWKLFRSFGNMDAWWKDFYTDVTWEPKGSPPDKIGVIRSFKTLSGRSYKEKLIELDEKEYRLVYSLEWSDSAPVAAAVTTVDFDQHQDSDKQTHVVWSSQFQPSMPFVAGRIQEGQKQAYTSGIQALQRYFNPAGAQLNVNFTAGRSSHWGIFLGYLVVSVNGSLPQRVSLSRRGSPCGDTKLTFPIESLDGKLRVITMGDRILADQQLGFAEISLEKVAKSQTVQFTIKSKEGKEVGEMQATVEITGDIPKEEPSMAETIGQAALNMGQDLLKKVMEVSVEMVEDAQDGNPNTPYKYWDYPKDFGPLPRYCKVLPAREAIMPKRTGQLFQRNNEYLYSQVPLLQATRDLKVLQAMMQKSLKGDQYNAFFRFWVTRPDKVMDNYFRDEELTAQLLRGVNPVKITMAKDKSEIPSGFHNLKDDHGRGVDELIAHKSLFYCDYWELMVGNYDEKLGVYWNQATSPVRGVMPKTYWYAPHLVCFKRQDGKLGILGIQLTRHKNRPNEIYRADTHPKNLYQLCKYHLSCADNQQHQFSTHLGHAHLLMEPFAVAANNAFPRHPPEEEHPIGKLLRPHFRDTIGINTLARQTLVSDVAPLTDATFSAGTASGLKIFSNTYRRWDFLGDNFVNALKKRGFDEQKSDGLEGYYYREDGFKVWNVFKEHFTSMVDGIYGSDGAVVKDAALTKWCNEMRDPERAAIDSFPSKIISMAQLVEVITSIVFYCSAQHAAVNFPQRTYVISVRNRPDSMVHPMPETPANGEDIDIETAEASLPSMTNAEFQAMFAYLLTAPPDNPFREYNALSDRFPERCDFFLNQLERLHHEIVARDKKLEAAGEIGYPYLDPHELPQSINI